MSRNNQRVVPFGAGWAVIKEGRKHVSSICTKQSWAIEIAKENAMKFGAEVIIYAFQLPLIPSLHNNC